MFLLRSPHEDTVVVDSHLDGHLSPFEIAVSLFGRVASLGQVYNEAQMVGARCAALACVLSAYSVTQHLRRNAHPRIRRAIVGIILLVPVYSLDACVGLYKSSFNVPSRVVREAYEAFALLAFMHLVHLCTGKPPIGLNLVLRRNSCLWHDPAETPEDARRTRLVTSGICQYALLCGVLTPAVALISWCSGRYHEGRFSYNDAYPYCAALQLVSQSIALWCMVQLLVQTREQLVPVRPMVKFMCIKLLIFATWVQSIMILILENLSSLGRISLWIETEQHQTVKHWWDPTGLFDTTQIVTHRTDAWHREDVRGYVGSGLGSFLLCVEMVAFAILQRYAYPSSEWDPKEPNYAASYLVLSPSAAVHQPLLARDSSLQGEGDHKVAAWHASGVTSAPPEEGLLNSDVS
ncbi:unnamed protein product [Polarella glacialis]|uniref:Transmembrane protein 184C n=1 Tax=Polarella glacialis TaxID=89957 RepID=A0A813HY70_POLGL|nr:unnamed protein product [Polarella glacialis]